MRERIFELESPEEVNEFLDRFPTGAIFKAGGCHKTMEGFGHVEAALEPHDTIHMGFIRVIESRPASNHVAELTGITHESPQFILFIEGKPVFDLDNWDITPDALEAALHHHLGEAQGSASGERPASDLSGYEQLLSDFLEGKKDQAAFTQDWLFKFQQDATPRSKDEFDHLNSLFGDVDLALVHKQVDDQLEDRAKSLLNIIRSGKI